MEGSLTRELRGLIVLVRNQSWRVDEEIARIIFLELQHITSSQWPDREGPMYACPRTFSSTEGPAHSTPPWFAVLRVSAFLDQMPALQIHGTDSGFANT